MTANLFAVLLQDVPRYNGRYRDRNGCLVRLSDVLTALAAAYPADLAEAGKVLEKTVWVVFDDAPNMGGAPAYVTRHDPRPLPLDRCEAVEFARADLIAALIARITAQEAQNKGLEAERNEAIRREETAWREANHANAKVRGWEATVVVRNLPQLAIPVTGWGPGEGEQTAIPHITPERLTDILDKLDAAETALAAMTKERDEAKACADPALLAEAVEVLRGAINGLDWAKIHTAEAGFESVAVNSAHAQVAAFLSKLENRHDR